MRTWARSARAAADRTLGDPRPTTARWRRVTVPGVLLIMLLISVTAGVSLGSVTVPVPVVWSNLGHALLPRLIEPTGPGYARAIVLGARAPRVLLAVVVGAGLSVVGMALQALVRNGLADPYLLGVSSGASVGAVLVIVSGFPVLVALSTSGAAFLGALVALVVVYAMARAGGRVTTTRLILSGVAVAYVLSALTSLLLLTGRPDQVREVLSWLLGGLGRASWGTLGLPAATAAVGLLILLGRARALNVLLAGDEPAATMGVDVARFRMTMFVITSLITGVLVSVSGPIGFVGLIVPHAVRMLVGVDHRRALPAAALAGASFLVWADLAARTVASPLELPVGILTALCGGPFFLWLIRRDARRGSGTAA